VTYENIRVSHRHVCTDEMHSYAYTFDHTQQAVVQKDLSSGVVVQSWPTDFFFTEVVSLEFDGYYWWTLEQVSDGFIIRKWERKSSIFASLISTYSFSSSASLQFSSSALAVEAYTSTVSTAVGPGVSYLDVDDASKFRIGDRVVIGPSTSIGYIGNTDKCSILGVVGNTVQVSPALASRYSSSDRVVSPQSLWVFNDYGDSPSKGSLIKLSAKTGAILLVDYGAEYRQASAATFYDSWLLYHKGGQVRWVSPATLAPYKVMAVDVLKTDRSSLSDVYGLFVYDSILYRLQSEYTYYSAGWHIELWSTYNLVSSSTVAEVYMVALSVEKPMQHLVESPTITTVSSTVNCIVLDQYMTPVYDKTVNFTTTAGTVAPLQAVTDTNGRCRTVYLGDTQDTLVTITADTA